MESGALELHVSSGSCFTVAEVLRFGFSFRMRDVAAMNYGRIVVRIRGRSFEELKWK